MENTAKSTTLESQINLTRVVDDLKTTRRAAAIVAGILGLDLEKAEKLAKENENDRLIQNAARKKLEQCGAAELVCDRIDAQISNLLRIIAKL